MSTHACVFSPPQAHYHTALLVELLLAVVRGIQFHFISPCFVHIAIKKEAVSLFI